MKIRKSFAEILENAINDMRSQAGVAEKLKINRCEITQITSNGRCKNVETGRFVKYNF